MNLVLDTDNDTCTDTNPDHNNDSSNNLPSSTLDPNVHNTNANANAYEHEHAHANVENNPSETQEHPVCSLDSTGDADVNESANDVNTNASTIANIDSVEVGNSGTLVSTSTSTSESTEPVSIPDQSILGATGEDNVDEVQGEGDGEVGSVAFHAADNADVNTSEDANTNMYTNMNREGTNERITEADIATVETNNNDTGGNNINIGMGHGHGRGEHGHGGEPFTKGASKSTEETEPFPAYSGTGRMNGSQCSPQSAANTKEIRDGLVDMSVSISDDSRTFGGDANKNASANVSNADNDPNTGTGNSEVSLKSKSDKGSTYAVRLDQHANGDGTGTTKNQTSGMHNTFTSESNTMQIDHISEQPTSSASNQSSNIPSAMTRKNEIPSALPRTDTIDFDKNGAPFISKVSNVAASVVPFHAQNRGSIRPASSDGDASNNASKASEGSISKSDNNETVFLEQNFSRGGNIDGNKNNINSKKSWTAKPNVAAVEQPAQRHAGSVILSRPAFGGNTNIPSHDTPINAIVSVANRNTSSRDHSNNVSAARNNNRVIPTRPTGTYTASANAIAGKMVNDNTNTNARTSTNATAYNDRASGTSVVNRNTLSRGRSTNVSVAGNNNRVISTRPAHMASANENAGNRSKSSNPPANTSSAVTNNRVIPTRTEANVNSYVNHAPNNVVASTKKARMISTRQTANGQNSGSSTVAGSNTNKVLPPKSSTLMGNGNDNVYQHTEPTVHKLFTINQSSPTLNGQNRSRGPTQNVAQVRRPIQTATGPCARVHDSVMNPVTPSPPPPGRSRFTGTNSYHQNRQENAPTRQGQSMQRIDVRENKRPDPNSSQPFLNRPTGPSDRVIPGPNQIRNKSISASLDSIVPEFTSPLAAPRRRQLAKEKNFDDLVVSFRGSLVETSDIWDRCDTDLIELRMKLCIAENTALRLHGDYDDINEEVESLLDSM